MPRLFPLVLSGIILFMMTLGVGVSAEVAVTKEALDEGWDWSVTASVTNTVTSILLVFFGALGWHVVNRQLAAMEESNRNSRDHHETLARPWMVALTIDGPKQVVEGSQTTLSVFYKFKNTGPTPAIIQSSTASWEVSERSNSKRIPLAEQGTGTSGPTICPPGDYFHLPIHVHIPAGMTLELMSERRLILIIHGEVTYSDCFGKKRSTRFGMQYGRFFHDSDTPDWQACGEYNAIT